MGLGMLLLLFVVLVIALLLRSGLIADRRNNVRGEANYTVKQRALAETRATRREYGPPVGGAYGGG